MIRYALHCGEGCGFEAWFGSSSDFDRQAASGQVACPHCGNTAVVKAPMAPAVIDGKARARQALLEMAAAARAKIAQTHEHVGDRFAAEVRAMAEGEAEDRPIWGEATIAEAQELVAEGLPVAPLPGPFAPQPPNKLH